MKNKEADQQPDDPTGDSSSSNSSEEDEEDNDHGRECSVVQTKPNLKG